MKKKTKKGVIPRQTKSKPPKVGGISQRSSQMNWSRVGRRKSPEAESISALAEAFKTAREQQGLSVAQVAKALQIAPATLIKFEEKASPISVQVLVSYAAQLGSTLELSASSSAGKKR